MALSWSPEFLVGHAHLEMAVHVLHVLHVLGGESRVEAVRIVELLEQGLGGFVIGITDQRVLEQGAGVVVAATLGPLPGEVRPRHRNTAARPHPAAPGWRERSGSRSSAVLYSFSACS